MSKRENHDSSAFYGRFRPPVIDPSDEYTIAPDLGDGCIVGDVRSAHDLPDDSVALVVTSPPYFAGKEYEEALGHGHIPASYTDFLQMLHDVFAACVKKLEPGGRIAVNVANLGRRPYRSLSADVIAILQDDLGLLLRGEVIWRKAEGAGGNCAWGSFRSPANPVLRDLTERVVIASKGRFDRARKAPERADLGHPSETTLSADEFMSATLDVWEIEPESARRVNHPAPFPVQLPERLIHLYTYKGDVVLDPFLGSGSTVVAAARTGRRGVGYDIDPAYVEIAKARVAEERSVLRTERPPPATSINAVAEAALVHAGFRIDRKDVRIKGTGTTVTRTAIDQAGQTWYFDVVGAFTTARDGLQRTATVWETIGRGHVIRQAAEKDIPLVVLTSDLPRVPSDANTALRAAGPATFFDVVELLTPDGAARLAEYAPGRQRRPVPGFWTKHELA